MLYCDSPRCLHRNRTLANVQSTFSGTALYSSAMMSPDTSSNTSLSPSYNMTTATQPAGQHPQTFGKDNRKFIPEATLLVAKVTVFCHLKVNFSKVKYLTAITIFIIECSVLSLGEGLTMMFLSNWSCALLCQMVTFQKSFITFQNNKKQN